MNNISSLAYVHPEAKLGDNVIVEPFAYVDRNTEIGDGTRVMTQSTVLSGAHIGNNCTIFPHATVGGIPQDLKFRGEDTQAIIGDNTVIRECATVNRGTASKGFTKIGSNCLIMAYCHIAHDCVLNDHVILSNSTQLAGEVEIDDYAIISGGALVHQFTKIGAHVMIQGGAKIGKDIPPFVMVGREPITFVGLNIVGLRRRGFTSERINSIQEIYRYLYQSGFNFTQARERIEKELPETEDRNYILEFVRTSSRGIVRGNMEG
ncbi:MAG: acyl-ACP--UDP-N-acetylglucosamine O-acyltransferase [Proteiniphilum sp.]|jgi:UDP-N-acetylglucosamine acyltransferase|uniref:acyl-ACP--UDP-N-acetylglucosamine O-acyltransferase n=1 Tax=Proteiniphilum sp. TaxID=1926877 RepID=UPI000925ADFC|nr:acyl-ACP--UDP-N-acetylglucosamine O-acyltransferase [Proteiniphilum sp.]MEA5126795.1 acyl-ACP--UDP-N-acetylglucosamine O-acyltransferase [Proteiniphilum sp.]OJV86682.1 MAG: acyl-[acyl-carrier-protein]--UDP-N-acetylglucosamine O-acyltransferase [Bacteroidia bacterium 44-10]